MVATERSQTLSEFRNSAAETIDRRNHTGEAEIITVGGEACAVLLSPDAYEEMAREVLLNRDVEAIRRSIKQSEEGKTRDVNLFFDELRAKLLAMEATQNEGLGK